MLKGLFRRIVGVLTGAALLVLGLSGAVLVCLRRPRPFPATSWPWPARARSGARSVPDSV